jgi:hypothetical protein
MMRTSPSLSNYRARSRPLETVVRHARDRAAGASPAARKGRRRRRRRLAQRRSDSRCDQVFSGFARIVGRFRKQLALADPSGLQRPPTPRCARRDLVSYAESKASARISQSNFSWGVLSKFCCDDVRNARFRTRGSPRIDESKRLIRERTRRPAVASTRRLRPADWLCRRSPSSPGRQTSRACLASPWPVRPCRGWPR